MKTWLGVWWKMVSNRLRELGSAYVVDDGLGDADEAAKRQARERKIALGGDTGCPTTAFAAMLYPRDRTEGT